MMGPQIKHAIESESRWKSLDGPKHIKCKLISCEIEDVADLMLGLHNLVCPSMLRTAAQPILVTRHCSGAFEPKIA